MTKKDEIYQAAYEAYRTAYINENHQRDTALDGVKRAVDAVLDMQAARSGGDVKPALEVTGRDDAPGYVIAAELNGHAVTIGQQYFAHPAPAAKVPEGWKMSRSEDGGVVVESPSAAIANLTRPIPKPNEPASKTTLERMFFDLVCDLLTTTPQPPEQAVPEPFRKLAIAAIGMSFGTDWNHGTQAKHYRRDLVDAAEECRKLLSAAPQPVKGDKP